MMVGNAKYQCSCVHYILQDTSALIISLSVGIGLPLIIIIVIIAIFLCCRRQSQQAKQAETSKYTDQDECKPYSRQLPNEYKTAMYFNQEDKYSRRLPENEDNSYSRRLPEADSSEYRYCRGLPQDNVEDTDV